MSRNRNLTFFSWNISKKNTEIILRPKGGYSLQTHHYSLIDSGNQRITERTHTRRTSRWQCDFSFRPLRTYVTSTSYLRLWSRYLSVFRVMVFKPCPFHGPYDRAQVINRKWDTQGRPSFSGTTLVFLILGPSKPILVTMVDIIEGLRHTSQKLSTLSRPHSDREDRYLPRTRPRWQGDEEGRHYLFRLNQRGETPTSFVSCQIHHSLTIAWPPLCYTL